jgi:hypothetical protein
VLACLLAFAVPSGHALASECVAPDSGPAVCISGIVTAPDYQVALIAAPGKPDLTRVQVNDTVGDWTVSEIGARFIVFKRADETVRLEFDDHTGGTLPAGQTASLKDGATPPASPRLQDRDQ